MLLENNKSLIKLNTFGVNCYAENFISIKTEQNIQESIEFIKKNQKKYFVLGGGSNILLTKNIEGLVLYNQLDGINILKEDLNTYGLLFLYYLPFLVDEELQQKHCPILIKICSN